MFGSRLAYTLKTLFVTSASTRSSIISDNVLQVIASIPRLQGCDYTSSFNRKGNTRVLKLLEKNSKVRDAFANLGQLEYVTEEVTCTIESFVCQMYGKSKLASVDQARLEIFLEMYKPKKRTDGLIKQQQLKKKNSTMMPPCAKVSIQKIKRCSFITSRTNNIRPH